MLKLRSGLHRWNKICECRPFVLRAIKAILGLCTIVFLVYSLVYTAMRLSPIDPARAYLGPLASESTVEELRTQRGWNLPLPQGLLIGLSQAVRGDFGRSFYYERPALEVVAENAPITYFRMFCGVALGIGTGLLLGLLSGINGWRRSSFFFALMYAIPSFCIVVLLLWGSSGLLGVTPLGTPFFYEILTISCAALYPAGAIAHQISNRLDFHRHKALHIDFLFMLHATRRQVAFIVWKESIIEATAIALNTIPAVFTAISFAEIIFNRPGFGSIFISSCLRNDLSIVVAAALLLAVTYVCIQKVGEHLTAKVDIRMRSYE